MTAVLSITLFTISHLLLPYAVRFHVCLSDVTVQDVSAGFPTRAVRISNYYYKSIRFPRHAHSRSRRLLHHLILHATYGACCDQVTSASVCISSATSSVSYIIMLIIRSARTRKAVAPRNVPGTGSQAGRGRRGQD